MLTYCSRLLKACFIPSTDIIKYIDAPCIIITPRGMIRYVNKEACDLFGYSSNELTLQPFDLLIRRNIS
jgi:PAS domain S-box-containing protein